MNEQRYQTVDRLHESGRTVIYRAHRLREGHGDAPVILKQLRALYPDAQTLMRFRREVEITRAAAGPGVIRVVDVRDREGLIALVLEDYGGIALSRLFHDRRATVAEVLDIGVQVARALVRLHRLDIVHKDINPANVVRCLETGEVKLIDFGIASMVPREVIELAPAQAFEGTPYYMSPEQTGRMNRALDHRSDFYSLGATLYTLLTGRPPFESADRLTLVHAHIAREPEPPAGVQAVLSELVMILLAKRADDRYQSASGLLHDLERCQESLDDGGITPFPLRQWDVEERLRVPEALYGRDAEVAALGEALDRAAAGASEVLLVAGAPGIGKTSLVREVHRLLLDDRGRSANFISGKFEQYNRGEPYASVIQAVRQFVRQVLAGGERALRRWAARIEAAAGVNGRALTDVIAELELLIGSQPPLDEVPPAEAENRFRRVFGRFLHALAAPEHPLVLFLDDLQWADLPSLRLIESLALDPDASHLLLIGSWRDNEVDEAHPLTRVVEALRAGGRAERVTLGPLSEADVGALVTDALRVSAEAAAPLAAVCVAKTGGNPFFLGRFLEGLARDGLLWVEGGGWRWDLDVIRGRAFTENVVSFMAEQLGRLHEDTRRALQLGACVGNTFSLHLLASLWERSRRDTQAALQPALSRGLLRPVGAGYWAGETDEALIPDFSFSFSHDRIQQAAYADLSDAAATHMAIGRRMLATLSAEERGRRLFELVDHLNRGEITDAGERDALADLNAEAGLRALKSAAYSPAHRFLSQGVALTDASSWARRHEATLALTLAAAEAAYLSGEDDDMRRFVAAVEANASDELERVRARSIEVYALIARNELVAAVMKALDVLDSLGVSFPREPGPADIEGRLVATLGLIGEREIASLVDLPALEEPRAEAARRLIVGISAAAYLAVPALLPLLAFELVGSTVTDGISRESPYGFAVFALVLSAAQLLEPGYQHGELALTLLERWDDRSLRVRPTHVVNGHVRYWTVPLRDTLAPELATHEDGVDTGDLEYGFWAGHVHCCNSFYAGVSLDVVAPKLAAIRSNMAHHKQMAQLGVSDQFLQAVANLRGEAVDPARLVGPSYDEAESMAAFVGMNYRGAAFVLATCMLVVRVIFDDCEDAARIARECEQYQDGAAATFHLAVFLFFDAMAHLGLEAERFDDAARGRVLAARAQLDTWAKHCPSNFAHRVHLIDAELARRDGDTLAALERYDQAIEQARASRFVQDEALASERAGRFHLERGVRTIARAYLQEARYAYQRWGASAAVAHLEVTYGALLQGSAGPTPDGSPMGVTTTTIPTSHSRSDELDLEALFRASHAIAGEIRLDRLLKKVMAVMIQSAGATRGFLALERGGVLVVEAAEDANGLPLATAGALLADCKGLAVSVAQYVARTGEQVVLADAGSDPRFAADPHLRRGRIAAILCTPVVHQGIRRGLVYLENDLIADCFTPARLQTAQILAAQAAIAIENASLVETLESKVHARTVELSEARERAEIASEAKSAFLASMSHELRTPLNAIMGYAQILQRRPGLATTQRDGLKTIYKSGEHLLELINDVLDMAKIEAQRLELTPTEVSLHGLLRGVVELLEMNARTKGVRLDLFTAQALPAWVMVDERRLRQVMLNLVSNAVKFTDRGQVTVRAEVAGAGVRFEVRDTGVGVETERLEAIFEPFEQAGGAEQRARGTGLGLPISQRLVQLMGGRIQVESRAGEGSSFWFELPLEVVVGVSQRLPVQDAVVTGYDGPRRRILVVDDRRINRMVLLDLLAPLDFEVEVACDGAEALEVAERFEPEMVLLDLSMPVMDGFEAARRLRAARGEAAPSIIAVSSSEMAVTRKGERQALFDDYVAKPVESAALYRVVRDQLGLTWTNGDESDGLGVRDPTAEQAALIAPPRDDLEALLELASLGNMTRLSREVRALTEGDPDLAPFAERIIVLADEMNDPAIQELLRSLL